MQKNQQEKVVRVALTGGHAATTALSVVEELRKRNGGYDICWIGPKYAMEGKSMPTLASIELPKHKIKFYPIKAGRIQRKFTKWSIISFFRIPIGFIHAVELLRKIKPDIVISFGGYAGFPVVVAGWLFRKPIILHDQTYSFNRANKTSSPFATKILVSRKTSLQYYPKGKTRVVGNPIMETISKVTPKDAVGTPPLIYITGGSTGAQAINLLVEEIIEKLLTKYRIIHQAGSLDYAGFVEVKEKLNKNLSANYQIHESISTNKVANIYSNCDLVISRAGANTVSEIIAVKRPALFIPLEMGNLKEQTKNAQYAEKYGIAKILDQEGLTSGKLLEEIKGMFEDWNKMVDAVKNKKSPDINASVHFADQVEELV